MHSKASKILAVVALVAFSSAFLARAQGDFEGVDSYQGSDVTLIDIFSFTVVVNPIQVVPSTTPQELINISENPAGGWDVTTQFYSPASIETIHQSDFPANYFSDSPPGLPVGVYFFQPDLSSVDGVSIEVEGPDAIEFVEQALAAPVVPEPGTTALLALGLGGAGWLRKRR